MYYTYVLLCTDEKSGHKLYIGSCSNLKNRYIQHIKNKVKTTKKYIKIELIYYEASLNKTDALRREKQLKTGFGRGYINRRLE